MALIIGESKNGAMEGCCYLGLVIDSTVRFVYFSGVDRGTNKLSITGRLICLYAVEIDHVTSQKCNLYKIIV